MSRWGWPPFFLTLQTLQWHSVSPSSPAYFREGPVLPCGPSLYPTSSSPPPFSLASVYSHHLLSNCFRHSALLNHDLCICTSHGSLWSSAIPGVCITAVARQWRPWRESETRGRVGTSRSHDSAQRFTGLSVGLYDTGFCKSRAIYTLVVISTERYLRYIS